MVCNVDIPGLESGEGQEVAAHQEVAGDGGGDVGRCGDVSTISPENRLVLGIFFSTFFV